MVILLFSGVVLAPETPGNKIGQTLYNKKRICKSTGTTVISESPDVKSKCIFINLTFIVTCTDSVL